MNHPGAGPEFLSLDTFARCAHVAPATLAKYVWLGVIEPSGWVNQRPVFKRSDQTYVVKALALLRSKNLQ
jgi:hypothetical protein